MAEKKKIETMKLETKKCPMCAETIDIADAVCRYCGTKFNVVKKGYCQTCHKEVGADSQGKCPVCGNTVQDLHIVSTMVENVTPPAAPAPIVAPVQTIPVPSTHVEPKRWRVFIPFLGAIVPALATLLFLRDEEGVAGNIEFLLSIINIGLFLLTLFLFIRTKFFKILTLFIASAGILLSFITPVRFIELDPPAEILNLGIIASILGCLGWGIVLGSVIIFWKDIVPIPRSEKDANYVPRKWGILIPLIGTSIMFISGVILYIYGINAAQVHAGSTTSPLCSQGISEAFVLGGIKILCFLVSLILLFRTKFAKTFTVVFSSFSNLGSIVPFLDAISLQPCAGENLRTLFIITAIVGWFGWAMLIVGIFVFWKDIVRVPKQATAPVISTTSKRPVVKEQPKDLNTVKDVSVILVGFDTGNAERIYREQGMKNILTCWTSTGMMEFTWPEGAVKNLTLSFYHNIPIGVINYDKWYRQVFSSTHLDRQGKDPEVKIIYTEVPQKQGTILLHWDVVDKSRCVKAVDELEKAVHEWS